MPVICTITADAAEELSPALQKVAVQENGKFVVKALPDGFGVEDVRGLKSTVQKLRGEIETGSPLLKALADAGITKPEDIAHAVDALGKVKAGSLKSNDEIERWKVDVLKKHGDELAARDEKLAKRTKTLRDQIVSGKLSPLIAAKGGSNAMDAILSLAERNIRVKEDTEGNLLPVIVGHDGAVRLTKKVGSTDPMGFDELIDEMRESQSTRGLFETKATGGSGATSQSGGSARAGSQQLDDLTGLSPAELIARGNSRKSA